MISSLKGCSEISFHEAIMYHSLGSKYHHLIVLLILSLKKKIIILLLHMLEKGFQPSVIPDSDTRGL